MKTLYLFISLLATTVSFGQPIKETIAKAMDKLETDAQFKHAIIGFTIVDAKTGNSVYEKNSELGLAPASCQKVIISAAAFELLGHDYRYKTEFGYNGKINDDILYGSLYLSGNGDPTFGSWRWKETNEATIVKKIRDVLSKATISAANYFYTDVMKWGSQSLPDGWVWQDIGNYYGAGSYSFNWHENQYDIVLKAGKKIGDPVELLSAAPAGISTVLNELKTAARGSGDQAYIYCAPFSNVIVVKGTIPIAADSFIITGADHNPSASFRQQVVPRLGIKLTGALDQNAALNNKMEQQLYTFISPPLDSMNYWFLKKSINLYGEAFVKTIAYEKTTSGSTDTGVAIIKEFWRKYGIERSAINIIDGSGLSPANRVTTNALVLVMQFAKTRSWFPSFKNALPEMNGIKMKDGYISGVRSYTGYVKSRSGAEYTFAFIVNNFDGSPGTVREKIWNILDLLK